MRLLSIVEATTVSGPVKPLLMFSRLARAGVAGWEPISHSLATTQRRSAHATPFDNELLSAARAAGLDVDVVPERFRFDPRVRAGIARVIAARAPDIVETHDFKSHFLLFTLLATGAVRGPRWVAFHHGYTRMSARVRAYQQLDRLSLRRADRVVTLCQPFVQQLTARGVARERIEVITNAVGPRARPAAPELAAVRQALGIAPAERIILSVGRLSVEKGHAELIDAFALLLKRGNLSGWTLLLVGDGGERSALQQRARPLGNRVRFAGHQPDAWPYFCLADVFALPSYTEGSPLVLLEAMAAGLPIVATQVGGIPEIVQDQRTALLVPPRNSGRLAAALAALGDEAARRTFGAAAGIALENFTPARYAARLLAIYAKVGLQRRS